jgi:hypothetical protein
MCVCVCVCVCMCMCVPKMQTQKKVHVLISQRTHKEVTVNFRPFSTLLLYVGNSEFVNCMRIRGSQISLQPTEIHLFYITRALIYE